MKGGIGVIVEITTEPDEMDHCNYMVVWLYRNCKVVRAWEEDLTHHAPVDDCFIDEIHDSRYDDDHWERPDAWERPPTGLTWDMYVDPHTGDTFARGDCVIIEANFVFSQYHRHENDVGVGDKCVLLDFRYEPNRNFGDIQKQYFILYSYKEESLVRVLECLFCHIKEGFRNKICDVPKKILYGIK